MSESIFGASQRDNPGLAAKRMAAGIICNGGSLMAEPKTSMSHPSAAFGPRPDADEWRKTAMEQIESFWLGQRKLLDEYESFSKQWLERRRVATSATLDTMKKMCTSKDPGEWVKTYNDWLAGSFARLGSDSRDAMEEGVKLWTELTQSMNSGFSSMMPRGNGEPAERMGKSR